MFFLPMIVIIHYRYYRRHYRRHYRYRRLVEYSTKTTPTQ